MKTIIYFLLSICSIIYLAVLSVLNIYGAAVVATWGVWGSILCGIGTYGALAIIFLFAVVNFFGNPIKIVFFVLLILVIIIFIVTSIVPDFFRGIFGIGGAGEEGAKAVISWLNF